jgi:hypothetical protein
MKPDAPAELRGEFAPIDTNVPGIRVCEYLPRLARQAHHYALIRSVTHEDTSHETALYTRLTGFPHPQANSNAGPAPSDYPPYGVMMGVLKPPDRPVPPYVVVGNIQANLLGQTGGFLGAQYAPFVIERGAHEPEFEVPGLALPEHVGEGRLGRRRYLLGEAGTGTSAGSAPQEGLGVIQARAFRMLTDPALRSAIRIEHEPRSSRDRYGRHDVGQNLLLARRLVEAGVPAIQVSWNHRGPWDTHGDNFANLKGHLLPRLDQGLAALLADLHERGLLDRTLVMVCGEFGRTPKINELAGRDHWPNCYSALLAGGGVRGGQVYGASDSIAAYPTEDPVGPWDLGATVLHCAGVDPRAELRDPQNRPMPICRGEPIHGLF